jgi:AGZA family xanthine/uracil permease-like MFS transporter
VVLPFALATVVGGIDCTESAAAVGDEYDTRAVIAVEGLATLLAGCCGGVIQTTPYIGHPTYKAMGGRAAYTLATALFVGAAGMLGFFGYLYLAIPKAAIFPILIFIGLEITAQSFHHTPVRHFAAVAIACVPALAYLVLLFTDPLLSQSGRTLDELKPPLGEQLQTLRVLSGGFIVTSLIWASMLAAIIDRRLRRAAAWSVVAASFTLFGVIHSPLAGSPLFVPWDLPDLPAVAAGQSPGYIAAGYAMMALILLAWSYWPQPKLPPDQVEPVKQG